MNVYFNGKRMPWYIPGMDPDKTVKLDPVTFTPEMLPKGRIEQGAGNPPLVVIPDVPNRISTRKDGYIELILSRTYDKEAHQSRNKKVIIGQDASGFLPGMMFPNDNYFSYFNHKGQLVYDPMKEEAAEEEKREETEETTKEKTTETAEKEPEPRQPARQEPEEPNSRQAESRTMKQKPEQMKQSQPQAEPVTDETLAAREKAIREKEEELAQKTLKMLRIQQELAEAQAQLEEAQEQQMMEKNEALRDHVYFLNTILGDYIRSIDYQVKRKPDTPMSLKQIRTINEVLRELRDIFTDSEAGEFLHLAEEPDPEHDNPGTTYGEMDFLLSAYSVTANTFRYGGLRTKKT